MKNRHHLLISSLLSFTLVAPHAGAQSRTKTVTKTVTKKKTVGELLSQAEDATRGGRLQMSKSNTALPSSSLGLRFRLRMRPV